MTALKIALLGYGKMGKEVESIALERGHSIFCKIDNNANESEIQLMRQCDVAIEFSRPESVIDNIKLCFEINLPIIIGTTGWYEMLDEIAVLCSKKNQAMLYASNFSIGVNLFFELNRNLARLMDHRKEYEVSIIEVHHLAKLDKPSGTAISLANQILAEQQEKKNWVLDSSSPSALEINIESLRKDAVIGDHTVKYQSVIDEISIEHKAFSRKGFAEGAVLAAEFIVNKKGVFTMKDLLGF